MCGRGRSLEKETSQRNAHSSPKVHFCVSSFTIDFPVPVTRTLWLSAVLLICEIAFKIFAYAIPCSEYYISRSKLIALHSTNRKECSTSPIASIWELRDTREINDKKRKSERANNQALIQKVCQEEGGNEISMGISVVNFRGFGLIYDPTDII